MQQRIRIRLKSYDHATLDHAFFWAIANLAETAPMLVMIDDAHWADAASLRSLVHLARRLAQLPVSLVVAMRPVAEWSG